ncbi:MAG: DUF86 domain-containing protein [Rhodospirillaceae bacterium]|nr:DUF86 domain-containing protein [Rhodospirillaceae bacterium]
MRSPSSKKIHRSLIGIAENIDLAKQFVAGCDAAAFAADVRTVYAVTRCLEIISEAVRRLPAALTARHPDVPWSKIKAAGNIYRHEYDNVSPAMLWNTVETALGELEKAVQSELRAFAPVWK